MAVARFLVLWVGTGCGGLNYYDPKTDPNSPIDPVETPTDPTDITDPTTDTTDPTTDPTTDTTTDPTTDTTTDTGTPATTPPAPVQLQLTGLSQDYGSNAGGTAVTVTGTFDAATVIEFNGSPATLVSGTSTEMDVQTPSVGVVGWVDVEALSVTSDLAPGAFQYWADQAGESGTLGYLSYVKIVGGYWTPAPVDVAFGQFAFTQGGTWELWQDYSAAQGSCGYAFIPPASPAVYDPGATWVELLSGASNPQLNSSALLGAGYYADGNLTPLVDVIPGSTYELSAVNGNADWPGFGIPAAIEVPVNFTVTSPAMNNATPPLVTRNNFTISWNGAAGDYVVIYVQRDQDVGASYVPLDYASCAVPDTGSFTIPSNTWPDWFGGANGDFLHIQVARVIENRVVLPHDNSENRAAGLFWYYGGALAD